MIACRPAASELLPVIPDVALTTELIPNKTDLDGYLTRMDDTTVMIGFVASKRKGAFRELIEHLWSLGYTVKIPTPLHRMQRIVEKQGFTHTIETDQFGEAVDVWVKGPQL